MCKKVAVAMSGGVDSSTTAFLLRQQGYSVIGLHMMLSPNKPNKDVKQVAKKLGIPLRIIDFRKRFKKIIIDNFVKQYSLGLTPNPCIMCNKFIKFDLLLKEAKKYEADFLATGHYAEIKNNKIYTAKDKTKDQSYFLCQIKRKNLPYLIFPLSKYTKEEVKRIALKNNYCKKKITESQDVCFIPKKNLNEFLRKYLKNKIKPGAVININNNKIVGKHPGIIYDTIGQRSSVGGKGPYYVARKNIKKNILYVTNKPNDPLLFSEKLLMKNVNWLPLQQPKFPLKCQAKCRYGQKKQNVTVYGAQVKFKKSQRAITPGQSIVFYQGRELLGGGIIMKSL